jgi:hypothetical protein
MTSWRKRHTKSPGGSLFHLRAHSLIERHRGPPVALNGPHLYVPAALNTSAGGAKHSIQRRFLPLEMGGSGMQTGRERPRLWEASPAPGASRRVAHVLSAGIAAARVTTRELPFGSKS